MDVNLHQAALTRNTLQDLTWEVSSLRDRIMNVMLLSSATFDRIRGLRRACVVEEQEGGDDIARAVIAALLRSAENDVDPVEAVAEALREAEPELPVSRTLARAAISGVRQALAASSGFPAPSPR